MNTGPRLERRCNPAKTSRTSVGGRDGACSAPAGVACVAACARVVVAAGAALPAGDVLGGAGVTRYAGGAESASMAVYAGVAISAELAVYAGDAMSLATELSLGACADKYCHSSSHLGSPDEPSGE